MHCFLVAIALHNINNVIFAQYEREIRGKIVNEYYYHYIKNIFGDILGLVDENGGYVADYTYDAWGNILSATASIDNSLRYKGYYYDSETDMYYCHTRYYVPKWLRWLNSDNVEYLETDDFAGINLFVYCGNNPVIASDPDGTFVLMAILIGMAIGAIVSGAASAVTQAQENDWDFNEINPKKVILDATFGAISGAIAATGIGIVGSMFIGAGLSGFQSVLEDVIIDKKTQINKTKFLASVASGFVCGAIAGKGANVKELSGVWSSSVDHLTRAVSTKKIAMYTAQKTFVKTTLKISSIRMASANTVSVINSSAITRWLNN